MDSLTQRFDGDVFQPYVELLKAGYRFHPSFADAQQMWSEKLTADELINGPFLEKSQIYKTGEPLSALSLHDKTRQTIQARLNGRNLYKHQSDALQLILSGRNAIIATGTSSGKTLCYQIPILDDLLRDEAPGLRAIIIYPLNALVNDQLNEWETMLKAHRHITFARFTGQTPKDQTEYEAKLRDAIRLELDDEQFTQGQLQKEIEIRLKKKLAGDASNRLNHREDIRRKAPNILITNFSMLEYLLERPVDAPIFKQARMKFLVLDEVHAYRGVQATEIACLVRRLKDRLKVENLICVATSATLGKQGDPKSADKVRQFASDLFKEDFSEPNPIYGTPAEPYIATPSFTPSPGQYLEAAEALRKNEKEDVRQILGANLSSMSLATLLGHDANLYRLRKEVLQKPNLLATVANQLWPNDSNAEKGLEALLEIVSTAKKEAGQEDLLPTRLHYFVRAQDGLHVCLHRECPGRRKDKPAWFVSRSSEIQDLSGKPVKIPEGLCPSCYITNRRSKLVEVVTCRKCGYLYGALQDVGPRRAQNPGHAPQQPEPQFDSFSTELGWAADSFWSYFSVDSELPFPPQPNADEDDDDQDDLFLNPHELEWCVCCGKKRATGSGDNCACQQPHIRKIKIFHRQCAADDQAHLYEQKKKTLVCCPNCGARNASGLEPVKRFQESDDETGLAMAIPLAHFQVGSLSPKSKLPRKLLCFTDHRQRAAAFPSLLEEETFTHDLGRKVFKIAEVANKPLDFVALGEELADIANPNSNKYDPDFFLPVSRFPDDHLDAKEKANLWLAEVFSYFGIPDSARESAEDLGLIVVEYHVAESHLKTFHSLLAAAGTTESESAAALQILLGYMRQRKAFTLPKGRVYPDAAAFGRVTADISYDVRRSSQYILGWLPKLNNDGSYRDNFITDYLRRLLKLSPEEVLAIAEKIWNFLTAQLLIEKTGSWKLDHERLFVRKISARHLCSRCGQVTGYSARQCCLRKNCDGKLETVSFDLLKENIIAQWVAGHARFTTLKSEEHTAQINKGLAERIENEFRADGVNLLSSTTTFEMGINIGDLQKVLLRNAPPTSASYVQRVGRAGRGQEKNSVCVTLCRRTKYDADAWNDPPRLMSGEIRPPTVFMKNRLIAQRHFNAVVFAEFLRQKISELGQVTQKIRLEPFLSLDSRSGVPNAFQSHSGKYLDFQSWLNDCTEADIFSTASCSDLVKAVSDFSQAKLETGNIYQSVTQEIGEDLAALLKERTKLFSEGHNVQWMDDSIKNLLSNDVISILAQRGFLPRYAFPLDVVTLETGATRWSRDSDVELSRDRAIAIAEFAPGAQVIAHKKVFTSAGLYFSSAKDKPDLGWYARCPKCQQIRTASPSKEPLETPCPVCNQPKSGMTIARFVQPKSFSIRVDKSKTPHFKKVTLIRQRQSLTHFIDHVDPAQFESHGVFQLALKEDGRLFRYNLGPQNHGFVLCPACGCSEPKNSFHFGRGHKRLRAFGNNFTCPNTNLLGTGTPGLAYGHEFQSFCLVVRPTKDLLPVESLAYALQKGLCVALELEASDIGVSWRWLSDKTNPSSGVEIVLYDRTPGGAGFVKEGLENWPQVIQAARALCEKCSCESACYDCLKDFGNQSHHQQLNRQNVVTFLKP